MKLELANDNREELEINELVSGISEREKELNDRFFTTLVQISEQTKDKEGYLNILTILVEISCVMRTEIEFIKQSIKQLNKYQNYSNCDKVRDCKLSLENNYKHWRKEDGVCFGLMLKNLCDELAKVGTTDKEFAEAIWLDLSDMQAARQEYEASANDEDNFFWFSLSEYRVELDDNEVDSKAGLYQFCDLVNDWLNDCLIKEKIANKLNNFLARYTLTEFEAFQL